MLTVSGNTIAVSTKTLDAEIRDGALISLKAKDGREYLVPDKAAASPVLELLYTHNETVPLKDANCAEIRTVSLSPTCAFIRIDALTGNGVIIVSEDEETGDLIIEPEVASARYGVMAARWTLGGIAPGLRVVAPFFQGVDMDPEDELLVNRRRIWPHSWEAGLCIYRDGDRGGFWVHCRDREYRSKAILLKSGPSLSLDSETWGPVERSLAAGGLGWRINVYEGSWHVPAAVYRDWLWVAYDLKREEALRPDWLEDIRLAMTWCPSDIALVDALADKLKATSVSPKNVLLHLPHWRNAKYDQCYPDFTPSAEFLRFYKHASDLGFRCMPHANSVDMDPSMPEYLPISDFKYRELERGTLMGWGWKIGMPASNKALVEHRADNVMVKIHPGLALWRTILAENIEKAMSALKGAGAADLIFLDVTLCMYNLANALVDNTTTMQGMNRLINQIRIIHGGLAVGGEGLNEITMQHQSFAQVHLFDFNLNGEPLERTGKCDLNQFMFGRICKSFGYSGMGGNTPEEVIRCRVNAEHGSLPTIGAGSAAAIENPNDYVRGVFESLK